MLKILYLLFVALGLFVVPAHSQEDPGAGHQSSNPVPVLNSAELETFYFTPKNVSARQLESIAERLFSREIFISERGGLASHPIQNLQLLGDTIIIYDSAENAQRIGKALHGIDENMKVDEATEADGADRLTVVQEWSPRHISLQEALSALTSFRRDAVIWDSRGTASNVPNMSILKEQGTLVMRDAPDQVAQMLELLERVDRREAQLMFTCLVIRGQHGDDKSSAGVPPELARNLSQLVPYENFHLVTVGVLRASARAKNLRIEMDGHNELLLETEAFDAEESALTATIRFGGDEGQQLQTRTTLRSGEYTVLGAAGSTPLFAVLKIVPIGTDN